MKDSHLLSRKQAVQGTHTNRKGTHSLKSRWISYAAAGAAAMASGQQADAAKVVNSGNLDMSGGPVTQAKNGSLALDLDNNGVIDVTLFNAASSSFSGSGIYGGNAGAFGGANGSLLGVYGQFFYSGLYNYALNFSRVSSIGPNFSQSWVVPSIHPGAGDWNYTIKPDNSYQWYLRNGGGGWPLSGWGSFANTSSGSYYYNNVPGFLGVRFKIGSDTHFGFVEMEYDLSVLNDLHGSPANVAKILSYGYEDVKDAHISGPGDGNFVRNDTIEQNWFESDDSVDAADFAQWESGFGMADPTQRDGDANRDGVVDGADYTIWRDQFDSNAERRSPPPGSGAGAGNAAVPEPNSLGLMAWGAGGLMALRRARRARRKQQEKAT